VAATPVDDASDEAEMAVHPLHSWYIRGLPMFETEQITKHKTGWIKKPVDIIVATIYV
jgi:hypothetical protein